MTKRKSDSDKTQRTVIGGLSGLVIIVIALFVQYGLGIDVFNIEEDDAGSPVIDLDGADPDAPPPLPDIEDIAPIELQRIPGGYDGGWFQLYFTEPINSTREEDFQGSPIEQALVDAIDGASASVDAALFELNSQPVTDALIAAHERGVRVRVVTDDEHGFDIIEAPDSTVPDLEDAGIPIVTDDPRTALMHNKFFVIDGLYVWTGSMNVTHNGIYNNNNNAMLIRSSRLAALYSQEFEELFAGQFGTTSPVETNLRVTIEGTPIEVYFESEGNAEQRLWELIDTAQSVRFMAFSFTDSLAWKDASGREHSVMQRLAERAAAGELQWQGIVEASSRSFTAPLYCVDPARIRQDGNPNILHHKVMIINDATVVMGSFNFSRSAATSNDENLLIIHNPSIASAYLSEFAQRWRESRPMPADAFDC